MYQKYTDGSKTISATRKAYDVIYKQRGFSALKDESRNDDDVIDYEEMTKADIGVLLENKGIEFNPRDKKDELINLLLGSG